jgi:dethiobiotin synthetase
VNAKKIIFITGTDTGVGKTLLTALLLHYLRKSGVKALAMKPFCSGGRRDVRRLQTLQGGELSDTEMNPFYFKEPLAPLIAAKRNRRIIRLAEVVARIKLIQAKCDCLLIEGSGGLLVPLGEGFTVADVIKKLDCRIIVVARNRLGAINHTLLTINALRSLGKSRRMLAIALMGAQRPDFASFSNQKALFGLLKPIEVLKMPFLGKKVTKNISIAAHLPRVEIILQRLIDPKNLSTSIKGS